MTTPRSRSTRTSMHVVVVGGSLAGLTTALALTRVGARVTILERAGGDRRTGAALSVDPSQLDRVLGPEAAGIVLAAVSAPGKTVSGSQPITWGALHSGYVTAVRADPNATFLCRQRVTGIGQDERTAWATIDTGQNFTGDLVIGADGHRSIVRRAVAPDRPEARFAGYLIWVGIAREEDLGDVQHWPASLDIRSEGDHCLLGYPLPADDGTLTPGRRRLGWAWYDATRNSLLHTTGAVRDDVVRHSLRADTIPEQIYDALYAQAGRLWSEPWRAAIRDSLSRREMTATPITEYIPDRLVAGRLALVGNAAHVPTPMTGSGLAASLDDAHALAEALRAHDTRDAAAALRVYERDRLRSSQRLVESGQGFSRVFASPGYERHHCRS